MTWNRILLPMKPEIQPDIVEIGKLAWDCYERENQPKGFGMFHAAMTSEDGSGEKFVVYLSPVASSICGEIAEKYPFEPCRVPARDEPYIAWVFGDPLVKNQLRDTMSSDRLVVS